MPARFIINILLILALYLLIDFYVFRGVRVVTQNYSEQLKATIKTIYWGISIGLVVATIALMAASRISPNSPTGYKFFTFFFAGFLAIFLPKLVFLLFVLVDDLVFVFQKIVRYFFSGGPNTSEGISRSQFVLTMGLIAAAIPFFSIVYGVVKGRFDFRVIKKTLAFKNLPAAFEGLRVVQISDAHLGSFFENKKPVERAIKMINDLHPDVIVFTGDLVNNYAYEAEPWVQLFSALKAKHGKFSILGNHDYGDYGTWTNLEAKQNNLEKLKYIHAQMGFDLLLNQHRVLSKNGENIALIGVENWGVPPFPQHGDLNKAKSFTDGYAFKILLSHDPSHWDAVVLKNHSDIDLTLSGHTHGMQFGIELGKIKWSPVKYRYPRWAGLYEQGKQLLYVNRGFGYIGFPGRVGIAPEITELTLTRG